MNALVRAAVGGNQLIELELQRQRVFVLPSLDQEDHEERDEPDTGGVRENAYRRSAGGCAEGIRHGGIAYLHERDASLGVAPCTHPSLDGDRRVLRRSAGKNVGTRERSHEASEAMMDRVDRRLRQRGSACPVGYSSGLHFPAGREAHRLPR